MGHKIQRRVPSPSREAHDPVQEQSIARTELTESEQQLMAELMQLTRTLDKKMCSVSTALWLTPSKPLDVSGSRTCLC